MKTLFNPSTLELLPDEILLEICKYLLCSDILYSFHGLNYRITCMINQYCQHLSLFKTYISIYDYLCINVIPNIGSQIRSLVLDCQYSVLQDILFIKYFGDKMSLIFPNLEKVTLISYLYDQVMTFLNSLDNLYHLVELHLYGLFQIPDAYESTFIQTLMQANNHRITKIIIDHHSSALHFINTNSYLNILQLRIRLRTVNDFSSLFSSLPNIQYLDVIVEGQHATRENFHDMKLSPLLHLTNFRLKSIMRLWKLEELITLFHQLPRIQCLSLFLATSHKHLIQGDIILPLLPSTVQQFNYAINSYSNIKIDDINFSSWQSSHPVTYVINDRYLFMHTIPWNFPLMEPVSVISKMLSTQIDGRMNYDRQIEQLYLNIMKNFSLKESLALLSKCHRVRELLICKRDYNDDISKEEQSLIPSLPRLSRLLQVYFYGTIPSDLNSFSLILNAAPNLCRLDLSFAHLWKLIENQQIRQLLGQRITALCILDIQQNSTLPKLNEEHIPIIASALFRICDLYVNLLHLRCSTMSDANEDILQGSFIQTLFDQTYEEKDDIISPHSSESMLLCLLKNFKQHRLIELCVDGEFMEKIGTNPEEWLQKNTILYQQRFKADFNNDLKRLLIWM